MIDSIKNKKLRLNMSHDINFIIDFIRQLFWTPQLTLVLEWITAVLLWFILMSLKCLWSHGLNTRCSQFCIPVTKKCKWNGIIFVSNCLYLCGVNILCIAAFEKKCMSMRNGVVYYGLP